MSKEQIALNKINEFSIDSDYEEVKLSQCFKPELETLQTLITKHEKLVGYLNKRKNKFETDITYTDFEAHYNQGCEFVVNDILEYLETGELK